MEMSPWDYWIAMRSKSWDELTEYEQERITLAAHLILCDVGAVSEIPELREYLRSNLPVIPALGSTPYDVGLSGFYTWRLNNCNDTQTYETNTQSQEGVPFLCRCLVNCITRCFIGVLCGG